MTRVLLLTHYFPPEAGAPQVRLSALAGHLQARGFGVTVHAPPPHYPAGAVLAGYRNRPLAVARRADGVRLVRSAVYATANRGVTRRLANHASFAASALATSWASGPQSVVVAETPPLFLAAAAGPYARAKRAALVLHVADRWPASAVALGALSDPRAIALAERLERWSYAQADAIAVPTEGMRDALVALPEAAGKVEVIPPAVDLERFSGAPPRAGAPLRVLYAGTVGLAHGLQTLAEASALAGPDVVDVTVRGDGALAAGLREHRTPNFRVLPAVRSGEVPALYARADVGAVLLRDLPIFDEALPTKALEIMAAGRPVLAAAGAELARLVGRHDAGVAVAPGDPQALAEALCQLARNPEGVRRMGSNARALAVRRFGREGMIDRWERLLTRSAHRQ